MQLPPQAARQDSACGARATRTRGALRRRTSSLARPRALRAREALVWMPGTKLSKPLLAAAIVALLDASTAALPRRHDAGQFTLQELVESATTAPPAATAPPSALSDAETARIATFGAVLGQYDACHDSAVVRALNDTLNTEWSQAERETWLAIGRRQGDARGWPPERLARCPLAAGIKRDACLGPPNKGWRIGVPCADTARWWVSDARWDAREFATARTQEPPSANLPPVRWKL